MSLIHERYHVLQQLGSGSFTHTELVLDLQSDQRPLGVLKGLFPQSTERGFVSLAHRLFSQEVQLLRELGQHEGIPALVDAFHENGVSYLVQEFVPGASLQDVFDQGQVWSEPELILFLQDALDILADVHRAGVIHRDLKPAHWIRRRADLTHGHGWEGQLTLIDFGVAQRSATERVNPVSRMAPTVSIGTSTYMAPEQIRGTTGFSSDLYALGLIALQGVTGMLPAQLGQNAQGELLWKSCTPLSTTITDILSRMVRYQPQDRYASAVEVLSDLQQYTRSSQWSRRISQWLMGRRSPAAVQPLPPVHDPSKDFRRRSALLARPQVLLSLLGEVPGEFLYALEEAVSTQVWISDGLMQNPGRDAAQQASLEAALQAADVYVVGLTPAAIHNPALLQQLQLFKQLQQGRYGSTLQLIPVRINLSADAILPDGVRQILRQVRQYVWRSPADTPRILAAICPSRPAVEPSSPLTSVA
jgi:serine/threonine-protein kinase